MLEPVICPKCRTLSHVDYTNMKRNNTLIKCSHFSEVIRQYERDRERTRKNLEALKRLSEEADKVDEELEGDIDFTAGFAPPEFDFRSITDPVWNCRCSIEAEVRYDKGTGEIQGFKEITRGLGYSIVPRPVLTRVKGFLYGFR